jgi:hypothetical protein
MPPADLSCIHFGYLLLIVQLFLKLKGGSSDLSLRRSGESTRRKNSVV